MGRKVLGAASAWVQNDRIPVFVPLKGTISSCKYLECFRLTGTPLGSERSCGLK